MSSNLSSIIAFILLISSGYSSANELAQTNLPEEYSYIENDLVNADFHKLVGKWTLRASTTKQQVYSHNIFEFEGENLKATRYLGEQVLSTSSICHMNHTKAIGALMNINGQQVKIIGLILYMDAQYIIQAAIDPSQNQTHVMVYARPETEFDAEYVIELIYNHLLVEQNVRQLIQDLVYKLEFTNPELTGFLPPAPRQISEEELAQFTLDQISGIFDLRYGTEEENIFEYVIGNHQQNDVVRISKIKGTKLIMKTTQYRVPNSRRIFKVYKPTTPFAPNVRSLPGVVNYVYVDNNTYVTYEYCGYTNKEYVRVFARQGHPVSAQFSSVPSSLLFKVRDLMGKLKAQYETKDQNIALEYQVINDYASIEDAVEQVDLNRLVGNWTLRASNEKATLFSHDLCTLDDQGNLHYKKYFGGQQIGSSTVSPIIGSKALRVVPDGDNKTLSLFYTLYLDHNYLVFFLVRANQPGRPAFLMIVAKDGTPFDTETELQLVLKNIYTKPELKQILGNSVYDLNFVNEKLNDWWPKANTKFEENELAQFEWRQVTGVFDLRYTSDGAGFAVPFDYTINSQSCVESKWGQLKDLTSFMKSFRMKATSTMQNITEIRVPNSRGILKVASTPTRYNPPLITKPYIVDYLYVDDMMFVVYEFCGFDPIKEHVRIYVRQGIGLSDEQAKTTIQKIAPSALEKINHLTSHIRPHYDSQTFQPNKVIGSWSLIKRWPGHINGDVRTIQMVDHKMIARIFNKGIQQDELIMSQLKNTNTFQYNSTGTDGQGLITFAYTDYDKNSVTVADGSPGFSINVYARVERKVVVKIRFV